MKTEDSIKIVPRNHAASEMVYGLNEIDLLEQIELYESRRETWNDIIFSGGYGRSLREQTAFVFEAWQCADNLILYMKEYLEAEVATIEDDLWREEQRKKKAGEGNAGHADQ